MQIYVSALSSDKGCAYILMQERGVGTPSQREISVLISDIERESREFFPTVFFLNCFQLKVILMLKWYIFRWHILISLSTLVTVWILEKKGNELEFQFHHSSAALSS